MIPRPKIDTLEKIDTVLRRLPTWRGKQRVQVLRDCMKAIDVMHQAGKITVDQATEYRSKVYQPLAHAGARRGNQ